MVEEKDNDNLRAERHCEFCGNVMKPLFNNYEDGTRDMIGWHRCGCKFEYLAYFRGEHGTR